MNNKKLIILATAAILGTATCFARPAPDRRPAPEPAPRHHVARPAPRHQNVRPTPAPKPAPRPHHGGDRQRNDSFWGRGGRNFWPGFIGGLVGSVLGG